jgi:lysophospholipase L1-like esterase
LAAYFDRTKINLVNRAIGGRSSRTFRTEGRWEKLLGEIKPGDFVLIQFGHNDGGEMAKGTRPRASMRGNGDETQDVVVESTGQKETVHSFGWYLRHYAAEAKAKGATPVICSLVPRKLWKDGKVIRGDDSYAKWAREAAEATQTRLLDLNEIIAQRYEREGRAAVEAYFADERTHTTPIGADVNAQCVVAGLKAFDGFPLVAFLSDKGRAVAAHGTAP